jgi:hypothetical protein
MSKDFEALKYLYNAFKPDTPLKAGDPVYVECGAVRGDSNIEEELGREILFSETGKSCQLYAGHRGCGKSTELLRLKQFLEENGCYVIYFDAGNQGIDVEDAQYTDVLLACTTYISSDLNHVEQKPLFDWLQERWEDIKDLSSTKITLQNTTEVVQQFTGLVSNLKAVPSLRYQIRRKIEPYTITLLKALNEFIDQAKQKLPSKYSQLAIIADSLDRIVPVIQQDGRTNHEHIFLDRYEQLKALNCHVIYTVPISLLYSNRAGDLRHNYGDAQILPMIQVKTSQGKIYQPGLDKMKEVIDKRVNHVNSKYPLKSVLFPTDKIFEEICLISGGHIRELLLIIRAAIKRTKNLPVSTSAIQRAIIETRDTYRRTVEEEQWQALAEVARSKRIGNNDVYRNLLFNRCILEYCDFNQTEDNLANSRWYDVNPLIKEIDEFKLAFTNNS